MNGTTAHSDLQARQKSPPSYSNTPAVTVRARLIYQLLHFSSEKFKLGRPGDWSQRRDEKKRKKGAPISITLTLI